MPLHRMPRAHEKLKIRQTKYWSNMMANGWTPERRKRQAQLIRTWKPWERSTGPKTPEGKQRSARRGFKGGQRQLLRELARTLRKLEYTR